MSMLIDLTGMRFGRLLVVNRYTDTKSQFTKWRCICDCGNELIVFGSNLRREHSRSCGCFKIEVTSMVKTTHGQSHGNNITAEYRAWIMMRTRCTNKNNHKYPLYGGRGITICDRWSNSFENFVNDMGERPTKDHSLDRIDVNGNYEPGNCRWATKEIQARNQRPKKSNTSGVSGVSWEKNSKKWRAFIRENKKYRYLGSFEFLEDAVKARREAEIKYWGKSS